MTRPRRSFPNSRRTRPYPWRSIYGPVQGHSVPNGFRRLRSARRWRWLMLLWSPPVGDLAAQVFRTELFQQRRLRDLERQLVRRPLHAHLQRPLPAAGGAARPAGGRDGSSVVSSSYLFDRLVRDRWGAEARWATLWFAAGVVTLLADGQLTFALGVAFGLAALRCLQPARGRLAIARRRGCALASPVAAVFLAGVVLAGADWSAAGGSAAPRSASGRSRSASPSSRTSPSPSPASSPSSSRPTSRSRSGALARSSSPRGRRARSASCARWCSATCSPRP